MAKCLYNKHDKPQHGMAKGGNHEIPGRCKNEPGSKNLDPKVADMLVKKYPDKFTLDYHVALKGLKLYQPIFTEDHEKWVDEADVNKLCILVSFLSANKDKAVLLEELEYKDLKERALAWMSKEQEPLRGEKEEKKSKEEDGDSKKEEKKDGQEKEKGNESEEKKEEKILKGIPILNEGNSADKIDK